MNCRKCGTEHDAPTVGFKASCGRCGAWLHSCVHCRLWEPFPGRCRSLTAEPTGDAEDLNFCEEFQPRPDAPGGEETTACREGAGERFLGLFRGGGGE